MPPRNFWPKMPAAIPPHEPVMPWSGQTPRTSSIFSFSCVIVEAVDEDHRRDAAGEEGPQRVHQVAPGADRDEPGQGAVVDETGVVPAGNQGEDDAAHHGEEGVDRHQAGDALQVAGAHDVEAEPADGQDPGTEGEKRDVADREGMGAAAGIAPLAGAEDEHRRQRQPAADGVDHHRPGVVVEVGAADGLEEPLEERGILPPDERFEEGVGKPGEDRPGDDLGPELGPFGNAAGDDGGDAGGEAEEEEVVDQVVPLGLVQQVAGGFEEGDAVGEGEADDEIDDGGDRPVGEDLHQGVYLVFLADRADFEKGEPGVHGEDHDRAEHEEQDVAAVFQSGHH